MLTPEENLALAFVLWGIALSLPFLFLLLVPAWIAERSRASYLAEPGAGAEATAQNLSACDSPVLSNRGEEIR